ncbi:thymidylate kinase [Dehalogenimonas lykanthroporepellens BL-DC-9]|jgi:dTMP kinase|nr:thymidylate kinase [Dehalogenimonas lykanthroporepellens BL-DC-9]
MKQGKFITFEGCEGAGKSTQAGLLAGMLASNGMKTILTREPGGTPLGEEISRLLKWGKIGDIDALSELLLFNASRAELVFTVIEPALKAGKIVICDRFTDSSLVYQGGGRGLSTETVIRVNDIATRGLKPDMTILLDIPISTGQHRKSNSVADRFEQEADEFHKSVRQSYLALAEADPERWKVVNGTLSRSEVTEAVWKHVKALLEI